MPKQKIEIEVPEGKEIIGVEYRFQTSDKIGLTVKMADAWQWPEFLAAPWIAMDADGEWWAFADEPEVKRGEWVVTSSFMNLRPPFVNFTPPPCTDWRQSKRRRPVS